MRRSLEAAESPDRVLISKTPCDARKGLQGEDDEEVGPKVTQDSRSFDGSTRVAISDHFSLLGC